MFVLEDKCCWISAADETGIDFIRNKVKPYCQVAAGPEFFGRKNVVFNEADHLTKDAQAVLRELIERHTEVRFIFMMNEIEDFEYQLKSRCAVIEFKNPPDGDIKNFVKKILTAENIQFDKKLVDKIVGREYPDMRKIISEIQRTCEK
jgi:replication factor C small subunit